MGCRFSLSGIHHVKAVFRHVSFSGWLALANLCNTKLNTMYKAAFFLLLIAVVTSVSFAVKAKNEKIELSGPFMAGSPIIVLNR